MVQIVSKRSHNRVAFLQDLVNRDQRFERLDFICENGLNPQSSPYRE